MPLPEWMIPYLKDIHKEYVRIGFTEEELLHMVGPDRPDEATMKRALEHLRSAPTGIGGREYYAREGLDYEPLREAVEIYRRNMQG